MPSTYPKDEQGPSSHPLRHRNTPSALTPISSRFLHPVQEQRILSWRNTTVPHCTPPQSPPTTTTTNRNGNKSAPASVFDTTTQSRPTTERTGSSSRPRLSVTCTCSPNQRSSCSCSTIGEPVTPSTPTPLKSYYSSTKKQRKHTLNVLPFDTPFTKTRPSTSQVQSPKIPDKKGLPSQAQMSAYQSGAPPLQQYGSIPQNPLPELPLARPPAAQPALPRIAGARDPISQQYWRRMFPPAGVPGGINSGTPFMAPGVHPAQMMGMPRPWGY